MPISVQFSMKYTILTTERKGGRHEFENSTLTKNGKNKTFKSRLGHAWIDVASVPIKPSKTLLTNTQYHEAKPAKIELVEIEKAIESEAAQSPKPSRVSHRCQPATQRKKQLLECLVKA